MMRSFNVLMVGLMLGGAGYVYMLKYDSERAAGRIARLQHDIVEKREQIADLKAEWSLLNQPRRIQDLVEKYHNYLNLEPLDPSQVGQIDDIPMRPAPRTAAVTGDVQAGARMLAIGKPGDLTGSLAKKPVDLSAAKTPARILPQAMPRPIDPKPNDPINALIR